MADAWDRRSAAAQGKVRDAGIRSQLTDAVGPFSPYWRDRLRQLGIRAGSVTDAAALRTLPAVTERDVCGGDPAGAARLVLQADETGWAQHAAGPDLRHGIAARLRGGHAYRRQVEAAIRPTSYHLGGLGMTLPLASTRADLDLWARAGARLWAVLGLTSADVCVAGLPVEQRVEHLGLAAAALGAGAPALHVGEDPDAVADALRLLPATVLALPAITAAETLDLLGEVPPTVATLLLVGAPTPEERTAAAAAAPGVRVLGVWGPPDGRVLYGESRAGEGYVTYPDLEVLDVVDPDTGAQLPDGEPGELVLTQLGFRGSALVRWRTGALLERPVTTGTAADGRTVPRLPSALSTDALVPVVGVGGRDVAVDLRAVSGALAARTDLVAFRVDLEATPRGDDLQLVVTLATAVGVDGQETALAAATAVRAAAGVPVARVVLDDDLQA